MSNIFDKLILNIPPIHDMDDLGSHGKHYLAGLIHKTHPLPSTIQPAENI